VLQSIRDEVSEDAFVNIMAQYHPCHQASEYPKIARRITAEKYGSALKFAEDLGMRRTGGH
jgi:putative pyruvate formate lyase activating enzyme